MGSGKAKGFAVTTSPRIISRRGLSVQGGALIGQWSGDVVPLRVGAKPATGGASSFDVAKGLDGGACCGKLAIHFRGSSAAGSGTGVATNNGIRTYL